MPDHPHVLCTIITPNFVDRALAVFESVRRTSSSFHFVALLTGPGQCDKLGFDPIFLETLATDSPLADAARTKYAHSPDNLRWTLKPILLLHLLKRLPHANIIYSDADTCFFRDPSELFGQLDGVLLTPHRRTVDPDVSTQEFRTNFLDGFFNAGFVAATVRGREALSWWAKACLHACEHSYGQGLFADQRYLDLLPLHFKGVTVCGDPSYNLADWNRRLRAGDPNPRVGMVHFTGNTIRDIQQGKDAGLSPYLQRYERLLHDCRARLIAAGIPTEAKAASVSKPKWDLTAATAQKLPGANHQGRNESVLAFLRRLKATRIESIVCDYDTVLGDHATFAPGRPDPVSVAELTRIALQGVRICITTHRGVQAAAELSSAFSPAVHGTVWLLLYGATYICRLSDVAKVPALMEGLDEVWRNIEHDIPANLLSLNSHLTAGGQLAIRCNDPDMLERVRAHARAATTRAGFADARVVRDDAKRAVYVSAGGLAPDFTTLNADPANAICIGTFGDELGLDYYLLSHERSLSCGTVSFDLSRCWNLAPDAGNARKAAYLYLMAMQGVGSETHFVD